MILAVVFDMDGTLIDSEPFWSRAEREVFGDLGVPITEELAATTAGMTTAAVTQFWYQQSPWEGPSLQEVEQAVLERVAKLIQEEGEPMPGVPEVLQRMQQAGFKLALATNSPGFLIPMVLERLHLGDYFQALVSVDDVHAGKPDPEMYMLAAKKLGVDPQHCLAVEDSATGLQSALSAGMRTAAVVPPHLSPHRLFGHAHIQLRTLADLSFQDLI